MPIGRGAGALVLLFGAIACGDDGKGGGEADAGRDSSTRPASCEPIGVSVACTGVGGCAGAQVCQEDGRFGGCDCGNGGGGRDAGGGTGGEFTSCGAACESAADCGGGFCIEPRPRTLEVEGLSAPLASEAFPGGMCSQAPLVVFSDARSCDPSASGLAQGCGSCGVCTVIASSNTFMTVCREKCTPSATESGCSRPEFTCGFSGACVEGCSSDEECRVYARDNDGDGLSDGLFYDGASSARCDASTKRCRVDGEPGAQAGDPCVRDDDCEADGICLTEASGDQELAFTGGSCTKTGCKIAGLECAGEGKCVAPRSWDQSFGTMCARECEHGAEPEAEQLGAAGHGQGCRAGYMCSWSGAADDPTGTCLPGNYNAVTANNVGAICDPDERSADCFSPFGHGRCMTFGSQLGEASFCTIFDCGTPGLPESVCGEGNTCLQLDDEFSACFHTCTDASQCGAGLACVSLGSDAPSVCTFGCDVSSECKSGEACARSGACVPAP